MFDITKYAKLTKTENKTYLILRLFLITGFFIGGFLFIKEFVFPTQIFYFDNSINSLANTISRPYESKNGTAFHVSTYGELNTAQIFITLPKEAPFLPKNTTISIKKSYLSFLAPINKEKYTDHIVKTYSINDKYYIQKNNILHKLISENAFESYHFKNNTILPDMSTLETIQISDDIEGFAPATLISSKNSIYVTDKNKKHPFQDERAFLSLGYNFDNVIKTNSEELSAHKKGKLFTMLSAHPFGTIFYTQDTNRTFIFDKNILNKISTTNITKQHSIIVQENSRTTTASCILQKTFKPRLYKCTMSLTDISDFNGNIYQFTLEDAPNTRIDKIKIKLFTTATETSFAKRAAAIKRRLNTIYN